MSLKEKERLFISASTLTINNSVFVFVLKNCLLSKIALVMSARSDVGPLSCQASDWTSNPDVVPVKDSSRQRGG